MSVDGSAAIVIIALFGSPFSPSYVRAPTRPFDFCAMNVAVYERDRSLWSLTERRVDPGVLAETSAPIGASAMRWQGGDLIVDVNERTALFSRPIRGRITLRPECDASAPVTLDASHAWWPVAPLASIQVDLDEPRLHFRGHGYHDVNAGDAPLVSSFARWTWSRARVDERAFITYDIERRDARQAIAFEISRDGIAPVERLERTSLPRTSWWLPRHTLCDPNGEPRVVRALENSPFYARSIIASPVRGAEVLAMHETLDLDRLATRTARGMIRFRMRKS